MRRLVLGIAIALAACGDDGHGSLPDGPGDGSNAARAGLDPSPPDVTLQWMVVGLSTLVVAGSIRSRRRDKTPL